MIFLEKLNENNLDEIHQLQKLVFKKLYSKYEDKHSPFLQSKSSMLAKIRQSDNYFYFVKEETKTIGYVRIVINKNQMRGKIGPIGITPNNEEQGLGTVTMLLVEKQFPEVKEWYLGTIFQEPKLVHFYTQLGYQETGEKINIKEGMDILFFSKNLN